MDFSNAGWGFYPDIPFKKHKTLFAGSLNLIRKPSSNPGTRVKVNRLKVNYIAGSDCPEKDVEFAAVFVGFSQNAVAELFFGEFFADVQTHAVSVDFRGEVFVEYFRGDVGGDLFTRVANGDFDGVIVGFFGTEGNSSVLVAGIDGVVNQVQQDTLELEFIGVNAKFGVDEAFERDIFGFCLWCGEIYDVVGDFGKLFFGEENSPFFVEFADMGRNCEGSVVNA